jgi:hypothetical protein
LKSQSARMRLAGKFILMTLSAGIAFAPQRAAAQQPVSVKEKSAEEAVAKFVEQVRIQNGLARLRRIKDGHLRQDACHRAREGNKSHGQSTGIGPPEKVGTLSVLWYSTLDPSQPPPELLAWAKGPGPQWEQPQRFSVGVCLVTTTVDPSERYWVDVGTYMGAIKSLLNLPTWD